jgi:hypothetical protein
MAGYSVGQSARLLPSESRGIQPFDEDQLHNSKCPTTTRDYPLARETGIVAN